MKKIMIFTILLSSLSLFSCTNKDNSLELIKNNKEYNLKGSFYNLKYLYNNKIINDNDILNISYWNNNQVVYDKYNKIVNKDSYTILNKENLSLELSTIIRNDLYNLIKDDTKFKENLYDPNKFSIDDIQIEAYCGYFSSYYFIRFNTLYRTTTQIENEIIGQYSFKYPTNGEKVVGYKLNK